jgi:thiamine biosynthesis lipoprotein
VDGGFVSRFAAMGSPCEVLVDTEDRRLAARLGDLAAREALRIERKFSRYRDDGVVHEINHSAGRPVTVDEETAELLDYAGLCHEMSGGAFDVTSGVLRRVWTFDGREFEPDPGALADARARVGWDRVTWNRPELVLPEGMEIDLGGIGKEYAVDRAAGILAAETAAGFIVNFGGDLFASGPRRGGVPWAIGVDDPSNTGGAPLFRVDLTRGGLATSGDARRFVTHRGRRLGHILDPRTGWPVDGAPRSVTVLAPTCIEAGTLSTFASLRGAGARAFLEEQGVEFRLVP